MNHLLHAHEDRMLLVGMRFSRPYLPPRFCHVGLFAMRGHFLRRRPLCPSPLLCVHPRKVAAMALHERCVHSPLLYKYNTVGPVMREAAARGVPDPTQRSVGEWRRCAVKDGAASAAPLSRGGGEQSALHRCHRSRFRCCCCGGGARSPRRRCLNCCYHMNCSLFCCYYCRIVMVMRGAPEGAERRRGVERVTLLHAFLLPPRPLLLAALYRSLVPGQALPSRPLLARTAAVKRACFPSASSRNHTVASAEQTPKIMNGEVCGPFRASASASVCCCERANIVNCSLLFFCC